MPRRKKNPKKPSVGADQPDAGSEATPGGEAAASLRAVPASDADEKPGDGAQAVPPAEGSAIAGGGSEAGSGEEASTADAETRSRRAFFGRSGHLAVMSEFLHRRINVAIPEVDVGDDGFVVKGSDDAVTRVQVKSATARPKANGNIALFNVPMAQLEVTRDQPALVYVFAVRFRNRWSDFVVIRRSSLFARYNEGGGARVLPPDSK